MFLNTRWELRIEVKHLNDSFQELLYEQDNQQQKEKIINEIIYFYVEKIWKMGFSKECHKHIITLMKQLSFAKEKGEAKQRIIEKKDIERN